MIPYKILGGGLAALALVGGIFYIGSSYGSNKKQNEFDKNEIVELNANLAEQKRINDALLVFYKDSDALKEEVSNNVQERTNVITRTEYVNRDIVREVFKDSPYLSKGWVYTHDQLAKGLQIDPLLAANSETSGFTEQDSLAQIGENYANARKTIEQKEGWDDFYAGVRAANDRLQDNAERGVPNISGSSTSGAPSSSDR